MTSTLHRNNYGLKRSMPCVDLNSMSTSLDLAGCLCQGEPSSSVSRLEQAAKNLLLENLSEMAMMTSTSKRQRLFMDDSDSECKDGYCSDSSDATPATAALERSIAMEESDIDALDFVMSIATYIPSPESNYWMVQDYPFDSSSIMSKTATQGMKLGHHHSSNFHVNDVASVLSRMSTTA